jgi:hypothetical protein
MQLRCLKGELLTIDIGIRMDNPDQDSHPYEFNNLMIVHVPESGDWTSRTLHKVGMTSPVFVVEMGNDRFQKINRAKRWCRYVLEDEYERLHIGGDSCSHCHPRQMDQSEDRAGCTPYEVEKRKRQQRCKNDLLESGEIRHASPGDPPSQVCI